MGRRRRSTPWWSLGCHFLAGFGETGAYVQPDALVGGRALSLDEAGTPSPGVRRVSGLRPVPAVSPGTGRRIAWIAKRIA